ncbi:hypothetical protein ACF0H5_005055 [Mactra antiquata]
MSSCSCHLAVLIVISVLSTVSSGLALNTNTEKGIKKLRPKRHVVLDNNKLCKAFGCVNGHCKESELRNYRIVCECFTGYVGKLCDRLKCPYDCGKHGKCARKGQMMYCKCDAGYYGTKCDSKTQPKPRVTGHIVSKSFLKALNGVILGTASNYDAPASVKSRWFAHTVSPKHVKFSEFHSHAEIDTSVKPDLCAPGFQCYHGQCDRQAMNYGVFQCLCNPNYTGLFCEKRCTLSCKNGGTCMVLDDGHQLCSCPFNYTGHYCEKEYRSII